MVVFFEDGSWIKPSGLVQGEKLLEVVIYESIFNTNDGKRKVWKEKRRSPLQLKGKRKRIIASEFLTPIGRLRVPNFISNHQLLQDPN